MKVEKLNLTEQTKNLYFSIKKWHFWSSISALSKLFTEALFKAPLSLAPILQGGIEAWKCLGKMWVAGLKTSIVLTQNNICCTLSDISAPNFVHHAKPATFIHYKWRGLSNHCTSVKEIICGQCSKLFCMSGRCLLIVPLIFGNFGGQFSPWRTWVKFKPTFTKADS